MALRQIKFTVLKVNSENQTYNFKGVNSSGIVFDFNFTFIPLVTPDEYNFDSGLVYGQDINTIISNFLNSFSFFTQYYYNINIVTATTDSFTFTIGNEADNIEIYFEGDGLNKIVNDSIGGFIQFEQVELIPETPIEPIVYDDKVILSRSPYFFSVSPSVLYDSINANVYIYRGNKNDIPLTETYNVSKSVIQAGQGIISFDLHKLLNDFTINSFNQTVSSGVQTVSNFDSVWCYIDCDVMLNGVSLYKVKQTLLAVDGFGFHEELANPNLNKKVLSTIDKHIIYNNSKYPIYFVSKDLVSITANGVNVPFTLNPNLNNQYFGYLDATQYAGIDIQFDIVFEYATEEITHSFEIKNECRDNLINCIFKNKYGFWQKIPFNKLSKKSMDIQSKDYMPVVSSFGFYSLNYHNKRSYLTNGTRKITCNTDFLPEYYNSLFTELMLSEQIYLEESGVVLPVNINTKSINYKTKLNDKLIQYSMDFEYSYNVINNVI